MELAGDEADAAWKEEKATGCGVVVAVLDSGVLPTPALTWCSGKTRVRCLTARTTMAMATLKRCLGPTFRLTTLIASATATIKTHGSMCAGIVAGRPINRMKMITGLALRARLMILAGRHGILESV